MPRRPGVAIVDAVLAHRTSDTAPDRQDQHGNRLMSCVFASERPSVGMRTAGAAPTRHQSQAFVVRGTSTASASIRPGVRLAQASPSPIILPPPALHGKVSLVRRLRNLLKD